jgi:cytochrome c oxidase cbb3-type subunit II
MSLNAMPKFRTFFWLLFAAFLFTWTTIVVFPWLELGHLFPIVQDDGTLNPWDSSGLAHQGEKIYSVNGCVYCHTQQVRDPASGADLTRGWGTAKDPEDPKKEITRRSYPRDYIWQGQSFLGNSRDGADLSNVGERFTDAGKLYAYLYDPYILNPHSSMPEYRFLFQTRKVMGQASPDAVALEGKDAPPAGYEVVPTAQGKALVAYLLSLKKNYHLKQDEAGIPYVPPSPTKS